MATLLTDKVIAELPGPKTGMAIVRDSKVKGLGVRILPAVIRDGKPQVTRSFILDYSIAGRRRIYTIGKCSEWKISTAREMAISLKRRIHEQGYDPAEELKEGREAPTVEDLCERFKKEHLPKLRASTRRDYERMLDKDVIAQLGNRKVADIKFTDIDRLHRRITERGSPISANSCIAMCSKLFSFAVKLRQIEINPVKGIERNRSQPRNRFLSKAEIASLAQALNGYSDQNVADLFRLLLLTGARRGETQSARWEQFDLKEGIWVKPSHATKQDREHRVPLAAPARELLVRRRDQADDRLKTLTHEIAKADVSQRPQLEEWARRQDAFVFPARDGTTGHLVEIKKAWSTVCKAAGIVIREKIGGEGGTESRVIERHAARIHDLRHTAASVLASSGASLPLIGQLLGHTQVATTQRYAHLFDDAQRAAVERLGALVTGAPSGEVLAMPRGKRR